MKRSPNQFLHSIAGFAAFRACVSLVLLLAIGLASLWAQSPSVITDHSVYLPSETIVVTFKNGPANRKDWIGIYPEGVEPGTQASTRWFYTDQAGGVTGLAEGTVTFANGLPLAGDYVVYLLENDGYTKLAQARFQVVDPSATLLRTDKRTYTTGETIVATFSNGPGNPKDWIGIYKEGQTPGPVPSTLWFYTDGTKSGTTGKLEGSITFQGGLTEVGNYVIHFLLNDTYEILSTETFTVVAPTATPPRILAISPANNSTDAEPVFNFRATIANGTSKVALNTVTLTLDGTAVTGVQAVQQGDQVIVTFAGDTLLAANSKHTYKLSFSDDATPPNVISQENSFTVAGYRNIILPAPLFLETFESTQEGALPAGWTEVNYTDITNFDLDFGNLDSASYATWTVVNASRFQGSFVTYSNPDNPQAWEDDYQRVLTVNPLNVVNGKLIRDLAQGRFAFGNSGYRNGRSQVLYLFTPDFDLTGKADIYVSFHSLWEQNQDSIGAVEYSVDEGQTWLPIVYMLDGPDVVKDASGNIDAVATFNAEHGDVARYTDPVTSEEKGGTYGSFVAAAISQDLAPFISVRLNDNAMESKRVELFRLPAADNKAKVRFRFAHAGTDSWYFGIDNFGLYSIPMVPAPSVAKPADQFVSVGIKVTLTANVTGTGPFTYQWLKDGNELPGKTEATLVFENAQLADSGKYALRVTNEGGTSTSGDGMLTVFQPAITGQWDFEEGDLRATVGNALEYFNADVQTATRFGTTTSLGIPDIKGQTAKVVEIPELNPMGGFIMRHGAEKNGGGGYVNQFTVIYDVLFPASTEGRWKVFLQTNDRNSNDGDIFANPQGGIGISGVYEGQLMLDQWHRVIFSFDLSAVPSPLLVKYIDGVKVGEQVLGGGRDGRWALYGASDTPNYALLFADNDGDNALGYVNSVQFRNGRITDADAAALGGPSAAGIPGAAAPPIQLSVSKQGAALVLSWTGGKGPFQVEKTTSLTTPNWQSEGAETSQSSVTVTPDGAVVFYRVRGK
jgi:hypothetical protein